MLVRSSTPGAVYALSELDAEATEYFMSGGRER